MNSFWWSKRSLITCATCIRICIGWTLILDFTVTVFYSGKLNIPFSCSSLLWENVNLKMVAVSFIDFMDEGITTNIIIILLLLLYNEYSWTRCFIKLKILSFLYLENVVLFMRHLWTVLHGCSISNCEKKACCQLSEEYRFDLHTYFF